MAKHHLNALTVFNVKGWDLARGLQAGIGYCVPLLLAEWFKLPQLSWIGIIAFFSALTDPQWPPRSRFFTLIFFTLGSALGSYIAVFLNPYPWPAALFAFIFCTFAILTRVWGSSAGAAGNLAAIILLIALGLSNQSYFHSGTAIAALSLAGGLWALVLAFTVGHKSSKGAISTALANVFRAEAAFLRNILGHSVPLQRGAVRDAIERARAVLVAAPPGWGTKLQTQRFTLMLSAAERAMTAFLAIRHLLQERKEEDLPSSALNTMAEQLDAIADAIMIGSNIDKNISTPLGPAIAEEIAEPIANAVRNGAAWIDAAGEYLVSTSPTDASAIPELGASRTNYFGELRNNLTFASLSFRHALRFAVTAAALTLVTKLLQLDYGYWITLTAVIVLQAYPSATWQRAAQRVGGEHRRRHYCSCRTFCVA
ncbi:MAG: hypothetical protein JSR80_01690 [Verrucomicrobia bacterium]|nr:hypothetical protein [Verrucomicrobiota bacterium]